jgi:hypothetical protein
MVGPLACNTRHPEPPEAEASDKSSQTSVLILLAVATLFFANFFMGYPGISTFDGDDQYEQVLSGQLNDWHPPIMARLWSVLRLVGDGNGPLFAVHVFLYWLGFGLIAAALSHLGRNRAAWAVVAVGVFPPFVVMNTHIFKDVGMAVALLTAYSLCFFYCSRTKNMPLAGIVIAAALLLYGILIRVNGIFAAAPLLVYLAYPSLLRRPVYLMAACIAVTATAIPASSVVNHRVLRATATHPESSLILFDIAGIAFFSNDVSVFWPGSSATQQVVAECYTPVEWDTLAHRSGCDLWADQYQKRRWVSAILKHPLAYAEHRLAHFNSELFFVVPRHHTDSRVLNDYPPPPERAELTTRQKIRDYLLSDFLVTPMFSMAIGFVVLALSLPKPGTTPSHLETATFCLAISGLAYTLGYLFVGVASQSRYHYWSTIAIFLASILCISEQRRRGVSESRIGWASVGIVVVMLSAIFAAHAICGDALSQVN